MILEAISNTLFWLFDKLLVLEIPDLPLEVHEYVDTAFEYIISGGGILANYTPLGYLMTLFGVLLAVDAGILIYHLIMWVVRKIPAAGVS